MTTALDVISGALRVLQVASDDVTLTASEANDALTALNTMVDSWSLDSLMTVNISSESFALTPGQQAYTIGTGGIFNTSRPIQINQLSYSLNGIDYPIQMVGYDDWAMILLKSLSTSYTQYAYYDTAYPLGTLYLYPIPNAATTLTVYSEKPFMSFSDLSTDYQFPPGYLAALKFNLSIHLAPEYQTTAGQDVILLAANAKAAIRRKNVKPITMQVDPAVLVGARPSFNIYRGR